MKISDGEGLKQFLLSREDDYLRLMKGKNTNPPLAEAAYLNCYDVSILIAYDLLNQATGVEEVFTVDGRGKGLTEAHGHEVLGTLLDDGYHAADGTSWQLFPDDIHMRLYGPYSSAEEMIEALTTSYGGKWRKKAIPQSFLSPKGARRSRLLIKYRSERRINSWRG